MATQKSPAVILFLAANPDDVIRLSLDKEYRAIREKIRSSDFPRALELRAEWSVRTDDLLQYLSEFRPQVVHFSGHGSDREELILHNATDHAVPVSAKALRTLFAALKDNVRLVVLNACFSRPQAEAIVESIDCAIGMSRAIGDEAAIVFAASFYSALGFGESVQSAFEKGRVALVLSGIPEDTTPQLLVKIGLDANNIFLVERAAQRHLDSSDTTRLPRDSPRRPFRWGAALVTTALLVACLFAWRHDMTEGRRPMLVVSSQEDDLENLAGSAEQSLRARLSTLGEATSHDGRWFPAVGARLGLTLTGSLSAAGAKVKLDLTATHRGSTIHHTHLLFSRSLLSEHVGVVGDPILKALHVDDATGRLIAANAVDPEDGDVLLRAAAGLPSMGQVLVSLPAAGSSAPVGPASADARATATAVAASGPNIPSSDAGSTVEQPGAVDTRPALLVVQLREAVKASVAVGELGQFWVDARIGKDQFTRVRAAFFDAERFTVRAILSKEERGSHVQDVEAPAGSVFIINGGEFSEDPPGAPDAARVSVGLIYSNGSVVSEVDAAYSKGHIPRGGLFGLEARSDGAVRTILLPRRTVGNRIDLEALGNPRDLLQAKWALIHPNVGEPPCGPSTTVAASGGVQGICRHDPRAPYARSAFCTRGNEFGFVTVTGYKGLSLYQFMTLLAAPRVEGGFACETALNLDGANTIQFRHWGSTTKSIRRLLHDHRADRRVANFLVVTPR